MDFKEDEEDGDNVVVEPQNNDVEKNTAETKEGEKFLKDLQSQKNR